MIHNASDAVSLANGSPAQDASRSLRQEPRRSAALRACCHAERRGVSGRGDCPNRRAWLAATGSGVLASRYMAESA